MANFYALDFGMDMGDAVLSSNPQPNNLQWGLAQSTDGGTTWTKFQQQRDSMEVGSTLVVRLFNTSDQKGAQNPGLANPSIDSGAELTSRAATDSPAQKVSAPWTTLPTLTSGRFGDKGNSAGLGLTDLPQKELCRTTIANEGHFALTLDFKVNGFDYHFREDPELVVGGGGGQGG